MLAVEVRRRRGGWDLALAVEVRWGVRRTRRRARTRSRRRTRRSRADIKSHPTGGGEG